MPELAANFDAQNAFPLMVKHLLPPGLRGIVVAGLLSALMGSLAGVFNACSTLFTVDLYEKWKPKATPARDRPHGPHRHDRHGDHRHAVDSGRPGRAQPVRLPAAVQGYLAPPIFVVFFFGVFWKRLNAKGCLCAMVVGFAARPVPHVGRHAGHHEAARASSTATRQGSFLWIINNINFQYFSILITLVLGRGDGRA